ncbi:MAG TPA: hypothetical protein VGT24_10020 [Candidatus Acidoferrales bacterium]|nr:hypothetical protein [Candidatus Acidoferrales bacterium]
MMQVVSIESGIAWSDFERMQVEHKSAHVARRADWGWAFNDRMVRKVIGAYIANTAHARKIPDTLDELKALDRVAIAELEKHPTTNRAVPKAVRVGGLAPYFAALIYRAIRLGEDSVTIAIELGATPWGIRQTLYRLNKTAKQLENGTFFLCKSKEYARRGKCGPRPKWDVQKGVQLRQAGLSLKEIGAKLGVPATAVACMFRKVGLKVRPARRARPTAHTFDHLAAIAMRKTGATYREIAERFGIHVNMAFWVCNRGPLAEKEKSRNLSAPALPRAGVPTTLPAQAQCCTQ